MGPQHGILGDNDSGIDLPESQVETNDLVNERKAARFSKTKEFKALKDYFEGRIEHYQQYLPNGNTVEAGKLTEIGTNWMIATTIIGEFKAVIQAYEQAREAVEDADRPKDNQGL